VVDELEWLRDTYGAGAYSFNDEIFTYDKKRTLEICDEIKGRKIGIPWNCQTRVDHVTKKLLVKMREANCQLVSFGIESGCQKILDSVRKKTTIEQNKRAVRWAKQSGLSVAFSVIIGYPGETEDMLRQTLDFIHKVEPDDVYLYLATPYPNIELRDRVKDMGWRMSEEWSNYEMQTPAFENPILSFDRVNKIRETFYNNLYSPSYILRQLMNGTLYGKIMAETALHQLLWRMKLPWISANFKKLARI
jgi:anaerobic magnesium-protoporphyrin IX monomethyl ester cyclase